MSEPIDFIGTGIDGTEFESAVNVAEYNMLAQCDNILKLWKNWDQSARIEAAEDLSHLTRKWLYIAPDPNEKSE
jgi:hypothetical protein